MQQGTQVQASCKVAAFAKKAISYGEGRLRIQVPAAKLRKDLQKPSLNKIQPRHFEHGLQEEKSSTDDIAAKGRDFQIAVHTTRAIKTAYNLWCELNPHTSYAKDAPLFHSNVVYASYFENVEAEAKLHDSGRGSGIRVGTDCSGLEAPIIALRNLKVPFKHVFSCDNDPEVIKTIQANQSPKVIYKDITTRDNSSVEPVDIYVAGFPCQPFSIAGKQQGFEDEKGRGTIFGDVFRYINGSHPKVFILENVKGLVTLQKGRYLNAILKALRNIADDAGNRIYEIHHMVTNTNQHGIPHRRPRWYCVGILKSCFENAKSSFEFPGSLPCHPIDLFLDPSEAPAPDTVPPGLSRTVHANLSNAYRNIQKLGQNPASDTWVVDCDAACHKSNFVHNMSPCVTRSRYRGHWITSKGRRMTIAEMLRLQGINPTDFRVAVSDTSIGQQIGNAMSVNVIERILHRALIAAGLVSAESIEDRWESGKAICSLQRSVGQITKPRSILKQTKEIKKESNQQVIKEEEVEHQTSLSESPTPKVWAKYDKGKTTRSRNTSNQGYYPVQPIRGAKTSSSKPIPPPQETRGHLLVSKGRCTNRRIILDSGATNHMLDAEDLTEKELKAKRKLKQPVAMQGAEGVFECDEETDVYLQELGIHITTLIMYGTTSVLSLGRLVDEHGFDYVWRKKRTPFLQKGNRKIWLHPQMFVPFLDDRSFCRPGYENDFLKNKSPEKSGAKSTISPATTWTRFDKQAEVFRTVLKGGPEWSSVNRRVTYDLHTKEIIDDETTPHEHENKFLYREVPGAPRDIMTVFHFWQPESEPEHVDTEAEPDPQPETLPHEPQPEMVDIPPPPKPSPEPRPKAATKVRRDKVKENRRLRKRFVAVRGGKHNIFTHFPRDENCLICQANKAHRAYLRSKTEHAADSLPIPTDFGDAVTCDHKIPNEDDKSRKNDRTAFVVYDRATKWLQSYAARTKSAKHTKRALQRFFGPKGKCRHMFSDNSKEIKKACEDLEFSHDTSTPHRKETNSIVERRVRQVKEGTACVLTQSGLLDIWWATCMRAYCFLHCIVDILVGAPGKESATAYEQKFGVPCNAPVIPVGAKIRYNPITEDDKAKTHQMGEKLLDGIFVGYHQFAGGAWSGDLEIIDWDDMAKATHVNQVHKKRFKAAEVTVVPFAGGFRFPLAEKGSQTTGPRS